MKTELKTTESRKKNASNAAVESPAEPHIPDYVLKSITREVASQLGAKHAESISKLVAEHNAVNEAISEGWEQRVKELVSRHDEEQKALQAKLDEATKKPAALAKTKEGKLQVVGEGLSEEQREAIETIINSRASRIMVKNLSKAKTADDVSDAIRNASRHQATEYLKAHTTIDEEPSRTWDFDAVDLAIGGALVVAVGAIAGKLIYDMGEEDGMTKMAASEYQVVPKPRMNGRRAA